MNNSGLNGVKLAGAGRLDRAFGSAWRDYRQAFKRCQKKLSPGAVHQLRVQTRRLLALVELFDPLLASDAADRFSRLFRQPFKASGRLRDVQVMLSDVEQWRGRFPAKRFKKVLRLQEERSRVRLARKLQRARLKRLKKQMDAVRRQLRDGMTQADGRNRALVLLLKKVDVAFTSVAARRRSMAGAEPRAIHRTRIGFKRFRYMVEWLPRMLSGRVPALAGGWRDKLRRHQRLMGDIQDNEMFLAALDEFMRREKAARPLRKLRARLERDRDALTARYLRRADDLFSFWNRRSSS